MHNKGHCRGNKKSHAVSSAWDFVKKIRAGRKPSSVPRLPGVAIIYLGLRLLESTSDLPGSLGRAVLTPDCSGDASLCDLAPGGVFQAFPVTREPGGLLPHRFTLAPSAGRSSFLWHCPWGRPLSPFGTALPCGARTFLPPLPERDHLTHSEL